MTKAGRKLIAAAKEAVAIAKGTKKPARVRHILVRRAAWFTCDENPRVGPLYYFAPAERTKPPYLKQIEVTAIVDIASDGTMAGVELVWGDLPPPPKPKQKARRANPALPPVEGA